MSIGEEKHTLISKHLILVLALIMALMVTEVLIFTMIEDTDIKDIMAMTFGTFGTWIGAGAAYFFGRENMRTATDSLLKMSGRTPAEILTSTTLREMKPRPVKTYKKTEHIKNVLDWLKTKIKEYLVVVVDEKNKYLNSISDEAVYLYAYEQLKEGKDVHDREQTINDLLVYFEKGGEEQQSLIEYAVELKEDMTLAEANAKIEKANKYIGVILDSERQPINYVTTNDIRRLLTKES